MIPRLQVSGVGSVAEAAQRSLQFLQWWRSELLRLLPRALRERLYRPASRLVLVPADDGSRFVCRGPAARLVYGEPGSGAAEGDAQDRFAARARGVADSARIETVLGLAPEQVLRTVVTYPGGAAADLNDILKHDIDRHTPFAPDDVWFDYLRHGEAAAGSGMELELLAAPRAVVEPLLEKMEGQVGALDGIDVLRHGDPERGGTLGINLLPAARRRHRHRASAVMMLVLALALSGLTWAAARQSLAAREALLAGLRQQVDEKRETAQATAALRARVENSIDDLTALADQGRQRPRALEVLAELTRVLPDDTWVEQLSLEGARVDIVGQSSSSTSVVRNLEQSPMFSDVEFRSQVVVDSRSGNERFRVEAQVVAPSGDES